MMNESARYSDWSNAHLREIHDICEAFEIAIVADDLHYAHRQGLVHRDVKPGNILLDREGKPHLVDFGLALRDEQIGQGRRFAGTPAYMSPEQARGEGHRVDGRSDIFSLGVVFYELLTGRRPFRSDSQDELLEQVKTHEPRPIRQYDERVPGELTRICFKAISKRTRQRYQSAFDLTADLRAFLANAGQAAPLDATSSNTPTITAAPTSGISGAADSFAVGLIYGPSGSGKSSLVKAGLLPILSRQVISIYVESSGDDTESRLLDGLRNQIPELPNLTLARTLVAIRQGQFIQKDQKVLLVIDQFEQWLHAWHGNESSELLESLRQCDGVRIQCIVMVRDDFWLAISRFMNDLEVDLIAGKNIFLVDLFDLKHARRVLRMYGEAFGRLPEHAHGLTPDQEQFLQEAVDELALDGKVACVRLALFAEMMKFKDWVPATLKTIGGIEGVGITFLEETFNAPSANPNHRLHQIAARAVLKTLLPEAKVNIKGRMRSWSELLAASGYANRPKDFEDLIRILDNELRLITPTDSERVQPADDTIFGQQPLSEGRFYQLTHDYLVHSIFDWLNQKQKATRRGRAELRLEEHSANWNNKPEARHLPTIWEWATIRLLTDQSRSIPDQRKMMKQASRTHGLRWAIGLAALFAISISIQQWASGVRHRTTTQRIQTTVATLSNSYGITIPSAIRDLEAFPEALVLDELRNRGTAGTPNQKLAMAYALAELGDVNVELISSRIADASPREIDNLVNALNHARPEALTALRRVLDAPESKTDWRLRQRLAVVALYLGDISMAREMSQ